MVEDIIGIIALSISFSCIRKLRLFVLKKKSWFSLSNFLILKLFRFFLMNKVSIPVAEH